MLHQAARRHSSWEDFHASTCDASREIYPMEREMSEEQAIIVERHGRVMVITLNRPDAMNAINGALSNGLWTAIQELDADDSLPLA